IYDGASEDSPIIASLSGEVIGDYYSTGNNMYITFISNPANELEGFVVYYKQVCGNRFVDPSGTVSSPGYPSPYPQNANECYFISVTAGKTVQITFTDFVTEPNYDVLRIYDGPTADSPLLASLSGGETGTVVTSTSAKVYMVFTSDADTGGAGFTAEYVEMTTPLKRKLEEIRRLTAKRPVKSVAADKIPDKAYDVEAVMLEKGRILGSKVYLLCVDQTGGLLFVVFPKTFDFGILRLEQKQNIKIKNATFQPGMTMSGIPEFIITSKSTVETRNEDIENKNISALLLPSPIEAKAKVRDLLSAIVRHLGTLGMVSYDLFGLAFLLDGEYLFLEPETKLAKYAPKIWKASHGS
ncbi:hypothetical protein QYM36_009873, partial [Artemia franciscana]